MAKLTRQRAIAGSFFLLLLTGSSSVSAETIFCLADGTQIAAERFETRDGKFLLYVPGSQQPLDYPSTSVKGINVRCNPASVGPAQVPGRFGIYGSNTIGERLMPMLVETFAEKKLGGKITAKITASEEQEITLNSRSGAATVIDLQAHGSGTSAKSLLDGKAMIGMSSRRINAEEANAVTAKFNLNPQAIGNEHVLALDGLAVIVNPENSVKQLSLEQIGRIFSSQVTNWSEVGGANRPIAVYRRDDKSGTTDTFKSLVMSASKLSFGPNVKAIESSETVSASVASDPAAIGFIGLPYINKNHPLGISSTCGISSSPSRFNVKTENYPLSRRLYLYTTGVPADPVARDLLQFVLSDDAQSVVQDAEFVEQTVELQNAEEHRVWVQDILYNPKRGLSADKDVPRDALKGFESLLGQMRRSSLMFRFEPRSASLDTRAQQDVGRLARFLSSPAAFNKRFIIVGFADAIGSWASNRGLAMERATQVARELERVGGIRVSKDRIVSMSYLAPTACNDTDAGLGKNRRVEIWISPE